MGKFLLQRKAWIEWGHQFESRKVGEYVNPWSPLVGPFVKPCMPPSVSFNFYGSVYKHPSLFTLYSFTQNKLLRMSKCSIPGEPEWGKEAFNT